MDTKSPIAKSLKNCGPWNFNIPNHIRLVENPNLSYLPYTYTCPGSQESDPPPHLLPLLQGVAETLSCRYERKANTVYPKPSSLRGVCKMFQTISEYKILASFNKWKNSNRRFQSRFNLKLMPIKTYSIFNPPLFPNSPINIRYTKIRANAPFNERDCFPHRLW